MVNMYGMTPGVSFKTCFFMAFGGVSMNWPRYADLAVKPGG